MIKKWTKEKENAHSRNKHKKKQELNTWKISHISKAWVVFTLNKKKEQKAGNLFI